MKNEQTYVHPITLYGKKIKEEGIVVFDDVRGLPSGDNPFISPDYVICIGHRGRIDLMYDDTPDYSEKSTVGVIFPNHSLMTVNKTDDYLATIIIVDDSMMNAPMLQIIGQMRQATLPSIGYTSKWSPRPRCCSTCVATSLYRPLPTCWALMNRHLSAATSSVKPACHPLNSEKNEIMATLHIDDIKALARKAHESSMVRDRLFEAMFGDNREEAVHSAWALTHLPKGDNIYLSQHREALVSLATTTANTSLRRISLALLERIDWSMPDINDVPPYYVALIDFCMEHLMMPDEPYGIRSLCMKLAYTLSLPYPELLEELRRGLQMLDPSELGTGVRHTYNKLLKLL